MWYNVYVSTTVITRIEAVVTWEKKLIKKQNKTEFRIQVSCIISKMSTSAEYYLF